MRKITLSFFLACIMSLTASAQAEKMSENMMTGNLKIYVVVAVLSIIMAGILIFLLSLEKRLKALEENNS
jgi:hypothetical protein